MKGFSVSYFSKTPSQRKFECTPLLIIICDQYCFDFRRIYIRIFGDIQVRTFLQPPIRGVVLQTYGAGNLPCNRADIMAELKSATDRGVIVFNCSQCFKGSVTAVYQTGNVRVFK